LGGIFLEENYFKNFSFPAPKREISKFRWELRIPLATTTKAFQGLLKFLFKHLAIYTGIVSFSAPLYKSPSSFRKRG